MTENETTTRDRILMAAKHLFFNYGIRSISMDDIARHLSISKKTIYHFFKDKDQIVEMLAQLDMTENNRCFVEIARTASDPVEEILLTMEFLPKILSRMNPSVIYDLQKYHPAVWNQFRQFREEQMQDLVQSNLRKGMRQGLYRPDINVRIMARLRMGEVEMGMNPSIYPPAQYKLQDVELALLDHWLHGILTEKGNKVLQQYKANRKPKKSKAKAA